ncbi:MAG TPA: hypothetical protein VFE41_21490 [Acetobacteraceae bacterium]|jgi:hypothetical protein|nr:hypothetical protein [Acetobacteraceae bacterium]
MSGTVRRAPPRTRNILLGIFRVATGRADGLAQFGDTSEAFVASLAPLVAFPLVGALLMLGQGEGLAALTDLLATLCALLAPAVLSYEVACRWDRAASWTRFAVAFNWCQWAIPVLAVFLVVLAGFLLALGVPSNVGLVLVVAGLGGYGLWLHWFLARHGLGLSAVRAALLVAGVNLATILLVLGPRLLPLAFGGTLAQG